MEKLTPSTFGHLRAEAERGNPQAQYTLGGAYYNGNGVARNAAQGAQWLLKAAEGGYAPAQCDLGVMYQKGVGVDQSYSDALKWIERPPNKETHSRATTWDHSMKGFRDKKMRFFLRMRFARATSDFVEAYKWFILAAKRGHAPSLKDKSRLERFMSASQIARAQSLVQEAERNYQAVRSPYAVT